MENRKNVLAVQGVNVPLIANLRIRISSLFIKRVPTYNCLQSNLLSLDSGQDTDIPLKDFLAR